MKNKVLDKEIRFLQINEVLIEKLEKNNVYLIRDLWQKNRKELVEYDLSQQDIHGIIVKLQLLGLDLGKKVY